MRYLAEYLTCGILHSISGKARKNLKQKEILAGNYDSM